ncbi:MAG: GxxExxY protein [Muribaculaceae bacterium]|nr:GxxExxY protein [Muribaculaceae bacterium]
MINISDDKARLALYYKIRGAAITVEKNLGPYMIEKFYEKALMLELASMGINVENQVTIPTYYKKQTLDLNLIADLVVENEIIVELKATPRIERSHIRQLLTYMKLMHKHYGLLLNFGVSYMAKYGMKAFILNDFEEVVNSNSNLEDKVGLMAFSL